MKLAIFTGLVAVASAQFAGLPNCARPCASNLPAQCNLEVSCICKDSSWITGISCCVEQACSPADQMKTQQVAQQLCDTVKVTLPLAASCPASGAATSAATAGSSGAAGSASSAASSGAVTASRAASEVQTTAASATSGASSGATAASSGTSTSLTSSGSPTSANAATHSGGAGQVFGSKLGAVGAAVAAVALL